MGVKYPKQLLLLPICLLSNSPYICTVGVGQNGGSFLAPPAPSDNFFSAFFFRSVFPSWAGNVSKKLRCSEFIVCAVVYTCTDPGKETWPLKKIYISCTDPSCHNWFPDFLLVRQNSFTTAYPMNCQNKLVRQLGSVHKNTRPFRGHISFDFLKFLATFFANILADPFCPSSRPPLSFFQFFFAPLFPWPPPLENCWIWMNKQLKEENNTSIPNSPCWRSPSKSCAVEGQDGGMWVFGVPGQQHA